MNDPNGLIQFRGEYHLFYQHNPVAPVWGNMSWGHASSRDLVHWRHLSVALRPEQPYDKDGVFSGCMVNAAGTPTAVYTGTMPETQCIATSRDMARWTKAPENPVVSGPPPGLKVAGFRDPYVWREGDEWFMVVGSGVDAGRGAILLYRSRDLRRWEYLHPAATGDGSTGSMWECPNLFRLADRWVLLLSPIPLGRSIYFTGQFRNGRFSPQQSGEMDCGGCFYAPQAFRDERGRRIVFGWLQENRPREAQVAAGWSGVMSLPRVLTLGRDHALRFSPAEEVKRLRRRSVRVGATAVRGSDPLPPRDIRGDQLEIVAQFEPLRDRAAGVAVRRSPAGEEETVILYDGAAETLFVDRSRSSMDPAVGHDLRSVRLTLRNDEPLTLRIFVDGCVVEVFANDRACLTSRIYPTRADSLGVSLVARGAPVRLESLQAWEMAL